MSANFQPDLDSFLTVLTYLERRFTSKEQLIVDLQNTNSSEGYTPFIWRKVVDCVFDNYIDYLQVDTTSNSVEIYSICIGKMQEVIEIEKAFQGIYDDV